MHDADDVAEGGGESDVFGFGGGEGDESLHF